MAATLGASLVQSNSILYGMSASNMHKLQSVQNSLTHVVLPSLRHLSASEQLSYLHWLPVHYRIQFKIATLTYTTLVTSQPSYLCTPPTTPSITSSPLFNPATTPYTMSTDLGRCAFSHSSPATWNSIPTSIKKCSSLHSFKRH